MNWQAFQVGALGVLRWASYLLGVGFYVYLWASDRKAALITTLALSVVVLIIGGIAGFGVYIGTR